MSIHHHLDDATIVSYTAGSLTNAMALLVSCHLSMCQSCRDRAAQMEELGGELLENLPPINMSDSALSSMLAALDMPHYAEPAEPVTAKSVLPKGVPAPLAEFIDKPYEELEWKRLAPGFSYIDLACQGTGAIKLMRIAPGKSVLPHTHTGNELTVVLKGSFVDEIGRFTVGDIADLDQQVEHQPLVDSQEDCICLIATDGPLRFTTLLGRIVQPLTGL